MAIHPREFFARRENDTYDDIDALFWHTVGPLSPTTPTTALQPI